MTTGSFHALSLNSSSPIPRMPAISAFHAIDDVRSVFRALPPAEYAILHAEHTAWRLLRCDGSTGVVPSSPATGSNQSNYCESGERHPGGRSQEQHRVLPFTACQNVLYSLVIGHGRHAGRDRYALLGSANHTASSCHSSTLTGAPPMETTASTTVNTPSSRQAGPI